MNVITAYSNQENLDEITQDLKQQIGEFDAKMVLFFASSTFDPDQTAAQMQAAFQNIPVFGCTTAGEIVTGKMLKNSIVAMAFNADIIEDIDIQIVENISNGDTQGIDHAFAKFKQHFNQPVLTMDISQYVGIILIDGLSGAEERIMDRVGDLTNVLFVGGSAGDDLKFEKTYVYANGKAYSDAALLALMKPKVKFDILKTQSFCELDKKLIATKVNEPKRTIIEFNNKPATVAYAEAVGCSVEDAANHFMLNPVGLMVGDEPYVRSPQQIQDQNIVFYCNVLEDTELSLLEAQDMIADTKQALEDKQTEMGSISVIINFHCILRTLELEAKDLMEDYGQIFADIPTIGLSTYGESYIGHINQTATMLMFH
jgi:hypothetical protein